MTGHIPTEPTEPEVDLTFESMQRLRRDEQETLRQEQLSSRIAFQSEQEAAINPFMQMRRQSKSLETNRGRLQKMLKSDDKTQRLLPIEAIRDSANKFYQRNPELKQLALITLRDLIKAGDTKEQVLKKVLQFYPDVSLADEVLDFIIETSLGEMAEIAKAAKEDFNQRYGREITAGRNIGSQAREAATQGLGSPTSMRDLYRNITGTPRDSMTLFQELSHRYAFRELKKVIDFLLHALGADSKSRGPSIPRGQLHRLMTETRSLQAILGVYRFFRTRMPLVEKLFDNEGLDVPPELNFESISKQFMGLVNERYPTADKVLQQAVRLGIEKWIMAKIIAFSQMRDAIREVAAHQIYRSIQHRDELYVALLDALEELEEELDELLEAEEEGEEKVEGTGDKKVEGTGDKKVEGGGEEKVEGEEEENKDV